MPRRKKQIMEQEQNNFQPENISAPESSELSESSESSQPNLETVNVERPVRRRRRRKEAPPDVVNFSELIINACEALAPEHVSDVERSLIRVGFSAVPVKEGVKNYAPYLPLAIGGLGILSIGLKIFISWRNSRANVKHKDKNEKLQSSNSGSDQFGTEFWQWPIANSTTT